MKAKFDDIGSDGSLKSGSVLNAEGPGSLRVDRILVPVDFSKCSDRALCYALGMAGKFDSTLILLHVVEPLRGGARLGSRCGQVGQPTLETARERLAELCRLRMAPGARFDSLVRIGLAHSEIADTAKALACDLIIMGTRGCTAQPSTMGSTADWVVHHASCPVLTLGPC